MPAITIYYIAQCAMLAAANGESQRTKMIIEEQLLPKIRELSRIAHGGLLESRDSTQSEADRVEYADVIFGTLRDALASESERQ